MKTHFGQAINGRLFVGLARQYVAAVNSKKGLMMEECWANVAQEASKILPCPALESLDFYHAPFCSLRLSLYAVCAPKTINKF